MRKLLILSLIVLFTAAPALAVNQKGQRDSADVPPRYLPHALDGEVVQVSNEVDGRAWSAWAYRNGAEYDLAVSVSTVPGVWSAPRLLGLDDGLDQSQPALAVDPRGAIYLAYSLGDGTLAVRTLPPFSVVWSDGVRVHIADRALTDPSLLVVGESLVLGYRDGQDVELLSLPLVQPVGTTGSSIYDGPDPTGGSKDDDDEEEDDSSDNGPENLRDGVEVLPVGEATRGSGSD